MLSIEQHLPLPTETVQLLLETMMQIPPETPIHKADPTLQVKITNVLATPPAVILTEVAEAVCHLAVDRECLVVAVEDPQEVDAKC